MGSHVATRSLQWGPLRMECPMIDKLHCAGLVGALGACLAVGCSAPAEKAQQSAQGGTAASSAPAVQSPVSINAEMVRVVDHAAHQLWNTEREGMAPKTDADWENVVEHATQIAAAGALIRLEGTGPNDRTFVQQPDWQKFGPPCRTPAWRRSVRPKRRTRRRWWRPTANWSRRARAVTSGSSRRFQARASCTLTSAEEYRQP